MSCCRRRRSRVETLAWVVVAWVVVLGAMPQARGQTGLTLRGDVVEGEAGRDVTMVFRADGFWQITEGMGTIQWDPHVMDYVSAGDFGIPEITSSTFSRIPEGMLSFDWSSTNALGDTLANGAVLFSLTFNLRGDAGESTSVAFTDAWTALHFESAENINLPFTSVSGTASIVPEPSVWALLAVGLLGVARRWRSEIGGRDAEVN